MVRDDRQLPLAVDDEHQFVSLVNRSTSVVKQLHFYGLDGKVALCCKHSQNLLLEHAHGFDQVEMLRKCNLRVGRRSCELVSSGHVDGAVVVVKIRPCDHPCDVIAVVASKEAQRELVLDVSRQPVLRFDNVLVGDSSHDNSFVVCEMYQSLSMRQFSYCTT